MTATADVQIAAAFHELFDPSLGAVRYRVFYGGRGSAKSWQFARALLLHGVQQPLRILCAREFQSSMRESVHRLLSDQVEAMGLAGFYAVQQTAIAGRNGTEFLFKGLRRDVNEIKSTEGIDVCWVEEAQAVGDPSWAVLIPTIRKPGSEIWVSFNPDLESDATYQRFVVAPPARSIVRKVGYRDNPWLPEVLAEEARELFKRDPEAYAHIWGGEPWTRSDAEVLVGKWIVDDFTPAAHWQGPYYGADWGFARDPAVLTRWWRADSRLYLEHEKAGVQLGLDELDRLWLEMPGSKEYVIRADSARPETIHEMQRKGYRVQAASKWDGSVKDGIEHLRSYERIVIHPRCTRAIQEARMWRYKTDPQTGDVLPKLIDAHNHIWDSGRYALDAFIKRRTATSVRMPIG